MGGGGFHGYLYAVQLLKVLCEDNTILWISKLCPVFL